MKTDTSVQINELTDEDQNFLQKIVKTINENTKVGCTGCGYCMPCPKRVDIPGTFSAYNKLYSDSKFTGLFEYMQCTVLRKDSTGASNCIECGKCELHCPQHIEIRKQLKNAKKELEGPIYQIAKKLISLVMKY